MTLTINDLLQTIKNRLNRSTVQKPNVEQLNAVIDRFVNGGRVVEDEDLAAFLNPPVVTEEFLEAADLEPAVFTVTTLADAALDLAADALTPDITAPSPEVEASLQALVEESEKLGLYEMTGNPLDRTTSIATPLTMDELVQVAELQKELAEQSGLDSFGNALTAYKEATDASNATETVATGDSESSEAVATGDITVAEVTELPENTISDEAANVESEQS